MILKLVFLVSVHSISALFTPTGALSPHPTTLTISNNIPHKASMGAYIHIPFCRRRCFYCDFPIQVVGERRSSQIDQSEVYARILQREIDTFASTWHSSVQTSLAPLSTVYFGGGTPSLMPDESLRGILSKLDQTIGISSDAEITLEMDPGTFDAARICRLTGMGFNRISVGIQSFSDLILTKAGRAHTSFDSYAALGILSEQACLRSYSVDLIAALPYLSPELWTETLDIVLGYKPPHISVYDLQIEERSAFGRWYSPYTSPLPTEQDSVGMYTTAVSKLVSEGGYEHYELSNYAISADHRSKHNQQYWQCKDTLGFGLGAASYIGGKRYTRPNRMQTYEEFVTSAEQNGDVYWNILGRYASAGGCDLVEPVAPDLEEFLMLSLRTADGLDMDKLQRNYGAEVRSKVESALAGYIEESSTRQSSVIQKVVTPNGECALRLADPQGFLLSNHIISDVFAKLR